jgi:hypothetical protein
LKKKFIENLFESKLKIIRNLGTLLVLLKNLPCVGFKKSDLKKFRHEMWEILKFEFFLSF